MDAAATGEMVYDFLKAVNVYMTKEIAEGIYTGVILLLITSNEARPMMFPDRWGHKLQILGS